VCSEGKSSSQGTTDWLWRKDVPHGVSKIFWEKVNEKRRKESFWYGEL
jgi:hypothetical protein